MMKTKDTHVAITIRVPSQWIADLDEWRDNQMVKPNRSEAIRTAVLKLIKPYASTRLSETCTSDE